MRFTSCVCFTAGVDDPGRHGNYSSDKGGGRMLENVVVVGGYRTYIGKENGIYRHIPAEKLGGHILHKLSGDYGAPDLVLAGNAVGAGGNIGRLMALEAGIPEEVPAFTIDSQCSSGMEAIVMAAAKIGSGQQQVVFAGGA